MARRPHLSVALSRRCKKHGVAEQLIGHLEKSDADAEVLQILDWYAAVYEELLAVSACRSMRWNMELLICAKVPVVKGRKTGTSVLTFANTNS
jgi:hypothetical protein